MGLLPSKLSIIGIRRKLKGQSLFHFLDKLVKLVVEEKLPHEYKFKPLWKNL